MDFKEAKRIVAYAKKQGLKSFAFGDLRFEFEMTNEIKAKVQAAPIAEDKNTHPAPPPEPTLREINDYIYGQSDETQ